MADTELEMMKDIPGYKVILKAVIKSQIQQLVEQLTVHTDEESIVLTASVADGTLSHLGSKSGKGFLDNNEDIKSQFLGYCLKNKHRRMPQNNQETSSRQIHPTIARHATLSLESLSPEKHSYSSKYYTRSSRLRHKPYAHWKTPDRKSLNTEQRNRKSLNAEERNEPSVCSGEAESLSEVQVTVCDDTFEIKVERLDNFEDAFTPKGRPKAKYDEMFAKEISEVKSKDKDQETFQNEVQELTRNINQIPFCETSNCEQGIFSGSFLANLAFHSNGESEKKSGSDVELIQEVDGTTVNVEEISESELQIEITDVKSLETQANQESINSVDECVTLDPQVSQPSRIGTTVLTPDDGTTPQSSIGQILVKNTNSQKALPEADPVDPVINMEASRFASHSSNDARKNKTTSVKARKVVGVEIKRTVDHAKTNTEKSNKHAADIFRQFLTENGADIEFEVMGKKKLAKLLSEFYLNVRTKDGQLYKLQSISHIRFSLNRYLRYPPFSRKLDIIRDYEFKDANKAFKAAVAKIKESGKGTTRHHPVIAEKDLMLLYSSKLLNPSTPSGLQNRVQMTLRLTFYHDCVDGMELMEKDTFQFAVDPDGTEYIYKSSNPPDSSLGCSVKLKEMKNSPGLCPVKAFKKYLSKLNPQCDKLWQYPNFNGKDSETVWYQNRHLGKHYITMFMSKLSKAVPLSRIYTNHSIRKTGRNISLGFQRCLEEIMTVASKKEN